MALANKYAAEDQTQRWLSNQVQALLNPIAHKAKTSGKTIRYANGIYKQRGDVFELVITVSAERRRRSPKAWKSCWRRRPFSQSQLTMTSAQRTPGPHHERV